MSSDTSKFHKSKQAAAVLKHSILDSYVTPFTSKTGSTSKGNRVAFIDGYAGPGRYEDGSEGSGAMLLRKARELATLRRPRKVKLHFVEDDEETVTRLRQIASAEGSKIDYTVTDADISAQLPILLDDVAGIPLFVYLDPCGLPIPMDEVAGIFNRPAGPGTPATEVLINLTAGLRRFAGMLYSDKAVETSLKKIDAVCGGDWWREVWLRECPSKDAPEKQKMDAELAVVQGYAARLSDRAGGARTWVIPVKPRARSKAIYYLIFATRSVHGLVTFGDSASKGLENWRRHNAEHDAEDTLFGLAVDWEEGWKAEEKKLKATWIEILADRITRELEKGQPFRIIDKIDEIFGDDLISVVRTTHLRGAITKVREAGRTTTSTTNVGDLYTLLITPT